MKDTLIHDLLSALTILTVLLLVIFPFLEGDLANAEQVVVSQQVTAEMSMTVSSDDLTMSPAIAGLTGGTGNASTTMTVITNNLEGYSVTLQASGTVAAMNGETQGDHFGDYPSDTPETWVAASPGGSSQFAFGLTNGTINDAGGNTATGFTTCSAEDHCFAKAPTTTALTIVNIANSTTTASGDTFVIKFRAQIPANPDPLVTEDWYTATTTLTAAMN